MAYIWLSMPLSGSYLRCYRSIPFSDFCSSSSVLILKASSFQQVNPGPCRPTLPQATVKIPLVFISDLAITPISHYSLQCSLVTFWACLPHLNSYETLFTIANDPIDDHPFEFNAAYLYETHLFGQGKKMMAVKITSVSFDFAFIPTFSIGIDLS